MVSKQSETWMKDLLYGANNVKLNLNENKLLIGYCNNLFSGVEYKIIVFYLDGASRYIEGFLTGSRLKAHQSLDNWERYLLKALRIQFTSFYTCCYCKFGHFSLCWKEFSQVRTYFGCEWTQASYRKELLRQTAASNIFKCL